MRTARTLSLLLLLLLIGASPSLTGCRALVREVFRSPKARLVDVEPGSDPRQMLRGGPVRLVLVLQVTNPNSYALSLSRVAYAGHLGSVRIAEGEHAQEVTLEGGGKGTLVRVPVDVLPANLREAFLKSLAKRSLDYTLDGSLCVGTPVLGVVQVPFSVSGSMDAVELLRRLGVTLY